MVGRIACGIILLFFLAACQQPEQLPTLAPTAAPMGQGTSGIATAQVPATNTPVMPTATFTPSATPVVLTPQPTPLVGPGVNITTPAEGGEILLGSEIVVSGLVQIGAGQLLSVTLVSATGHTLDESQAEVNDFNSWQATLTAPNSVSGKADIQAALVEADGTIAAVDVLPVMLQVNPAGSDRHLILYRPLQGEEAVAGYNIFFDGVAQQPVDSLVTISMWSEGCQNQVAKQSFRLRGSGYWQGYIVVPTNANGKLCAVAHFGEPGDEEWRESQIEVFALAPDDDRALNVMIGNPPPESVLTPGDKLLLYGTAYNAPDREILLSILLENGRLLTESVAAVDIFGYWELELFIPADASGPAQIEASFGEPGGDDFVQSKIPVNIGDQE